MPCGGIDFYDGFFVANLRNINRADLYVFLLHGLRISGGENDKIQFPSPRDVQGEGIKVGAID